MGIDLGGVHEFHELIKKRPAGGGSPAGLVQQVPFTYFHISARVCHASHPARSLAAPNRTNVLRAEACQSIFPFAGFPSNFRVRFILETETEVTEFPRQNISGAFPSSAHEQANRSDSQQAHGAEFQQVG